MSYAHEIADMDEDDLRARISKLEEALEKAEEERDEAQDALVDQEAVREAAVAYLGHVHDRPRFDPAAWRMYEAQLRIDLVNALFADTGDNTEHALSGLLQRPLPAPTRMLPRMARAS